MRMRSEGRRGQYADDADIASDLTKELATVQ